MTPDFPSWANALARQSHHFASVRRLGLQQLEALFCPWIPHWRLAQQDQGPHSRQRRWNLRLVFWSFLWQVAQAGAPCREAIRQAQAWCLTNGDSSPPDDNSPYVQARAALPLERLEQIHQGLLAQAQDRSATKDHWCARRVLTVDGSTVTAPDTHQNQKAFPQQKSQKPGCGFPLIRMVVQVSVLTIDTLSCA